MSTKRKSHSARFKAKVALEAYKGDKTAVGGFLLCQVWRFVSRP
jgi:hypothetical protein